MVKTAGLTGSFVDYKEPHQFYLNLRKEYFIENYCPLGK
jgi:hypothetical protein